MAYTFKVMIDKLKKEPKRIVFTEGSDPRILEAASRLLASNFLTPILLGKVDEVEKAAEVEGFNIRGAVIIDPENYDKMDEMVDMFCEIRKSKGMTPEKARPILSKGNYFGTMLIKMGEADCLLGGATYSTADTVRPALQIIKTKPGNKIVSSCFILVRPAATGDNMVLAMADCAINRCTMPAQRQRLRCRMSRSTVSSSSTQLFLRSSHAPSARTPRWQAMRTPSSSRISTQATSATRSLRDWATSMLTARSFSA